MPDTTIRDTQVQQAQNNPSIISPLVGGQTNTMQAPSTGINTGANPTLQMFGQQATPEIQQAYQQVGKPLAQELYGGQFLPGLTGQRDAMQQQLFQTDKALEASQKGVSAFPTPQWYVPNPAEESRGLAQFGGQVANSAQEMSKVQTGTEQAYQSAISSVLGEFVRMLQMKEDRERAKEEREYQEKMKREEWARDDAKTKTEQSAWANALSQMGLTIDQQGNISPTTTTTTPTPDTQVDADEYEDLGEAPTAPTAAPSAQLRDPIGNILSKPGFLKETALNTASTLGGPVTGALNLFRKIAGY